MSTNSTSTRIAIIGAGPGGLVAARYLKAHGYEPVIFDKGHGVGGQWRSSEATSGIWSGMSTNTSRVMTAFSDLPYPKGTPVFPKSTDVLAYLEAFAQGSGLSPNLRLGEGVEYLERDASGRGWTIRSRNLEGTATTETFEKVIVATGRYNSPALPQIPGLDTFSGRCGLTHTFRFKGTEQFAGRKILIAGGSISALEIASLLARNGVEVIVAQRNQRYVMQKLMAGVPADHVAFTRFGGLAGEVLPAAELAGSLKEMILESSGHPEQFGALPPKEDVLEAGITCCQDFLPLVAEGRIQVKPWIHSIAGNIVRFDDDTELEVDGILFGTGYRLNLPFLSDDIRQSLNLDGKHIELHANTFHPELPGLAFLGLYQQAGPYFPTLELQARWITYTWKGLRPAPRHAVMQQGLAASRAAKCQGGDIPLQVVALQFARLAGVEPDLEYWPQLKRALLFGPLSPISFRLSGPDALPEAPTLTALAAAEFGAITSPQFTSEECAMVYCLEDAGAPTYQAA